MYKLKATIIKDIRILLRDKVGIALMFVMPIILVVIVTSIQNSTFQLVNKNRIAMMVCNRDTGKLSTQLIKSIDKIGMFKMISIPKSESEEAIKNRMRGKDALLAIVIPADYTQKITAKAKNVSGKALNSFGLQGDTASKKISVNPLTMYFQPILQQSYRFSINGALRSALQIVESRETLRQLYFAINEKPLPEALEKDLLNNQTNINEVPVSISGGTIMPNASQHNVPAWTIFAMFFIIISLGGSVVREKLSGSFIRLKTLPTDFMVALISKQITYLGVTVLQAAVIFSMGIWLFPLIGLPALNLPSDYFALLVVTLVCGWCAVSYAICMGVYAHTQEQANGFGAVSIVILAAIGGLLVPSFAMPDGFKTIAVISPLHWSIEAYYRLFLEGGKLKDVIPNLLPLLGITVLIQLAAYIGLKKKNLI
ncbi:ABC transporter permease [Mucilaginibacter jinjuensis]|uniref:ABC transporter permease n=1 Tax=Mucilaginibacter jinjuensis TaxID=1176721 RepID=A0ABY7T728_9SPHI|nr:ABC transporter permease [Mucilaginibacter jinjuensis]WCT12196.1 ABC transporter permease [Mucilaginibacter jinjuensis]